VVGKERRKGEGRAIQGLGLTGRLEAGFIHI
jgi:hypothetical protein